MPCMDHRRPRLFKSSEWQTIDFRWEGPIVVGRNSLPHAAVSTQHTHKHESSKRRVCIYHIHKKHQIPVQIPQEKHPINFILYHHYKTAISNKTCPPHYTFPSPSSPPSPSPRAPLLRPPHTPTPTNHPPCAASQHTSNTPSPSKTARPRAAANPSSATRAPRTKRPSAGHLS